LRRPLSSTQLPVSLLSEPGHSTADLGGPRPAYARIDAAHGAHWRNALALRHTIEEGAMFKHILIPTDGSDLSRKAVLYGVQLAKECRSKVTALTLAEPY